MSPYLSIIYSLFLLCGDIERADAEGETLEVGLAETASSENLLHSFALRKGFYGADEIVVGTLVFRNEPSVEGQQRMGVEPEELSHGEADGACQLYDAEPSAGTQYAAHFAESCFQLLKVAYAKGSCDGVEGVVGKRHPEAVLLAEGDGVGKTFLLHFLLADAHHPFRDVHTYKTLRTQHLGGEDGKIARTGSNVKYNLRTMRSQLLDGFPTPTAVDVPR